jgi:hypothetical protein
VRTPTSLERGLDILLALGTGTPRRDEARGLVGRERVRCRARSRCSRRRVSSSGIRDSRVPAGLARVRGWQLWPASPGSSRRRAHPGRGSSATWGERASRLSGRRRAHARVESPARAVRRQLGRSGCPAGARLPATRCSSTAGERSSRPATGASSVGAVLEPRRAGRALDRLCEARERGFAVADEDFEDGVVGVARPCATSAAGSSPR